MIYVEFCNIAVRGVFIMTKKNDKTGKRGPQLTRRTALKTAGAVAGATVASVATGTLWTPKGGLEIARSAYAAGSDKPVKIGFQAHRTGIGATYGRWYERTTQAAVKQINATGGIAGRPIELIIEDDGTDPKRGAEVVEKLASQHNVDVAFGTLFSHVVIGSAPRAAELKLPYFVVSEGTHVSSGSLNRYTFQPGISDVRSQMTAIAGWILDNLGKNVTIIYPDYAFGYDHRDFFGAAVKKGGGTIKAMIPAPLRETSFTKYFPQVPADTDLLYHVMVGPGVLTFIREMGEHFGSKRPQIFGFIDSLEGKSINSPGLEFLDGTYFWESMPRYASAGETAAAKFFRESVGVNDVGASVKDSKDTATYSHMWGCWETLYIIKEAMEQSGYGSRSPKDTAALIETLESMHWFNEGIEHPQGPKQFNGKTHQSAANQYISKVENKRLNVVHRTSIEDSLYETDTDYTKMPL
jgi:branched-chain amino acid transport system substrate-binding protein